MHILDADTLLAIPDRAAPGRLHDLLDGICDLVQQGDATFPIVVKNEVLALAGDAHRSWVRAIAGSCQATALPYDAVMAVMGDCQGAIDPLSEQEPSQVYVAATAIHISGKYENVVVVTDEHDELPDRLPLGSVCETLDVKQASSIEFYIEFDLAGFLAP